VQIKDQRLNDSAAPAVVENRLEPLLYRWDDLVLSFSPATKQLNPHYHGAAELVVTLDQAMSCTLDATAQVSASSLLIPPGVTHQNEYKDAVSVTLYFDSDSACYSYLTKHMTSAGQIFVLVPEEQLLQNRLRSIWAEQPDPQVCYPALMKILHGGSVPDRAAMDSRISQILTELRRAPADDQPVSHFATGVGLSEDRLHHLFTQNVGISLHRYRLWLRLKQASRLYFQAFDLTYAAQESGFADAAHFSRTFKRMFGASPQDTLALRKSSRHYFS